MARVRQARRCTASRTDGRPCRGWAIVGGTVCRAHGGAAPQVRRAAARRIAMADARRAVDTAWRRYRAALDRWEADRRALAATLLQVPVRQVDEWTIQIARLAHREADWPERPRITEVGTDRRLRANR